MVRNCKSALTEDKKPYHMILNGSHATGKNLTIKKFFHEVEKRFPNVKAVHINCKNHRTAYEIYLKTYEKLFNKNMSGGGLSTFTLFNKIIKEISKKNIILLVALDDMNHMKTDKDLNNVLYNLLRSTETNEKAKITVFSITNNDKLIFLDSDVRTVFNGINVSFPKYTFDELHNIISERCRLALYKGAINNEIINDVAKYTSEKGNLRKGLSEIHKAGLNAEYEGCHKILKRHF